MKPINADDFDLTITGEDFTDTALFDPEEVVRSLEEESEAERTGSKDISARRRFEIMREDKELSSALNDVYDEFLNS